MGYLSQRKKSERENLFLRAGAVIFVLLTALSFAPFENFLFPNLLLHFYVANLLFLLYSLVVRRFSYAGLFLVLFIINFFHISTFANILFNTAPTSDASVLSLNFSKDDNRDITDSDVVFQKTGYLMFAGTASARFFAIEKNSKPLSIVKVDWSKVDDSYRRKAFQQLISFVESQDNPVIIYGRFGAPAWGSDMRELQKRTGLRVKNRLTLADDGTRFNLFSIPDFYVMGFVNLGVKEINLASPQGKEFPLVSLHLGFD